MVRDPSIAFEGARVEHNREWHRPGVEPRRGTGSRGLASRVVQRYKVQEAEQLLHDRSSAEPNKEERRDTIEGRNSM